MQNDISESRNSKHEIRNPKHLPAGRNHKSEISKQGRDGLGFEELEFRVCLVFRYWDFRFGLSIEVRGEYEAVRGCGAR
jgi:hypothetical protein